nr:MAG TPA: hypothetical protein [Microviridae sp.]
MRTHTKTKQIHDEYNINFYYFIRKIWIFTEGIYAE